MQSWGETDVEVLRNCSIGDKIQFTADYDKTVYTIGGVYLLDKKPKSDDLIDDDIPF